MTIEHLKHNTSLHLIFLIPKAIRKGNRQGHQGVLTYDKHKLSLTLSSNSGGNLV